MFKIEPNFLILLAPLENRYLEFVFPISRIFPATESPSAINKRIPAPSSTTESKVTGPRVTDISTDKPDNNKLSLMISKFNDAPPLVYRFWIFGSWSRSYSRTICNKIDFSTVWRYGYISIPGY